MDQCLCQDSNMYFRSFQKIICILDDKTKSFFEILGVKHVACLYISKCSSNMNGTIPCELTYYSIQLLKLEVPLYHLLMIPLHCH